MIRKIKDKTDKMLYNIPDFKIELDWVLVDQLLP